MADDVSTDITPIGASRSADNLAGWVDVVARWRAMHMIVGGEYVLTPAAEADLQECLRERAAELAREQEPQEIGTADLYFIGANDGPIKIGISQSPEKRLKQIQTSYPFQLSILALCYGGAEMEAEYHARFAAHRLTGEWFKRHPDILAEIERLKTAPNVINGIGDRRKTLQTTKEPTE